MTRHSESEHEPSVPINSVRDLRATIADSVRRYVQHLDFEAPTAIETVRIEATGPYVSLTYSETRDGTPTLNVTINSVPMPTSGRQAEPDDKQPRKWLP
jgi:hypothetical protein